MSKANNNLFWRSALASDNITRGCIARTDVTVSISFCEVNGMLAPRQLLGVVKARTYGCDNGGVGFSAAYPLKEVPEATPCTVSESFCLPTKAMLRAERGDVVGKRHNAADVGMTMHRSKNTPAMSALQLAVTRIVVRVSQVKWRRIDILEVINGAQMFGSKRVRVWEHCPVHTLLRILYHQDHLY